MRRKCLNEFTPGEIDDNCSPGKTGIMCVAANHASDDCTQVCEGRDRIGSGRGRSDSVARMASPADRSATSVNAPPSHSV